MKIKRIKKYLERILIKIVQHIPLTCLVLFLLSLIIGGFLFYKYSFLTKKIKVGSFESLYLREEAYREVLNVWKEREQKFQETDFKKYPDSFRKTSVKIKDIEKELENAD